MSAAADRLGVPVDRYDEAADAEAWAAANVPGAPYVVALDGFGLVLAKGTVNDAAQLRSVLATAEARVRAAAQVERPGADSSRRAFLARAAAGVAGASLATGLVRPGEAEAYHFCGHIYTTDGCPHPTGLPRIDRRGFPLRAFDGRPVDDLGRLIDGEGRPVGEDGAALTDLEGRPLPGGAAQRGLQGGRARLPDQGRDRRRLVPLLRRPGAQARRLLLARQGARSTATRRSRATAIAIARSSVSCITSPRSRAEPGGSFDR